jgi:hypothetical protein
MGRFAYGNRYGITAGVVAISEARSADAPRKQRAREAGSLRPSAPYLIGENGNGLRYATFVTVTDPLAAYFGSELIRFHSGCAPKTPHAL